MVANTTLRTIIQIKNQDKDDNHPTEVSIVQATTGGLYSVLGSPIYSRLSFFPHSHKNMYPVKSLESA